MVPEKDEAMAWECIFEEIAGCDARFILYPAVLGLPTAIIWRAVALSADANHQMNI